MPRLMPTDDEQIINIPGPGNFNFSAVRFEDLGASEYTLYTSVLDFSGSVRDYYDNLIKVNETVIESLKDSPRAENLLYRNLTFNNNVTEIHGFKELGELNLSDYNYEKPQGMTALFDATFDAVSATLEFSSQLAKQDYHDVNGIVTVVTDGLDNQSKLAAFDIGRKIEQAVKEEKIQSLITILISLTGSPPLEAYQKNKLDEFSKDVGFNSFIDIGEATPKKLAKLAAFISQSVSSQSNSLQTGAPSQILQF